MSDLVSGEAMAEALDAVLDALEDELASDLRGAWRNQAEGLSSEEIAAAVLAAAVLEGWLSRWRSAYTEAIHSGIVPRWRAAADKGRAILGVTFSAAQLDDWQGRVDAWIADRAALLIDDMASGQLAAQTAALTPQPGEPVLDPAVVAALVVGALGLTVRQARGLRGQAAGLARDGVATEAARTILDKSVAALRSTRSTRVARTELVAGFNRGALAAAETAAAAGLIDGQPVKRWQTAADQRVCAICGPLDGVQVSVEDDFQGGVWGAAMHPPAHPGCRCVAVYSAI